MVVALGRLSSSAGIGRRCQFDVAALAGVIGHLQGFGGRPIRECACRLAVDDHAPRLAEIAGQRFSHQLMTETERGGTFFQEATSHTLLQMTQQFQR